MAGPGSHAGGKFTVGFLSLSSEPSIQLLICGINNAIPRYNCVFSKLTANDLQDFRPQGEFDAVVLLHSIFQGRNSITDVADARYKNMLPQLKSKYGPDRVGVVVHSMTSFNPDTKDALMIIFKKSQPTTFRCSNCVIQCDNPAEMPEPVLTRLVDFLKEAPSHPLPTVTHDIATKSPPTVKDLGDVSKAHTKRDQGSRSVLPSSELTDKNVSSSQPHKDKTTETAQASYGMRSGMVEGAHATASSSFDVAVGMTGSRRRTDVLRTSRSSVAADGSSVDPQDHPLAQADPYHPPTQTTHATRGMESMSPIRYPHPDMPEFTYHGDPTSTSVTGSSTGLGAQYEQQTEISSRPLAVVVVHNTEDKRDQKLRDLINRSLPGKTIILTKTIKDLHHNWHLFGSILIDVGSPEPAQTMIHGVMNTITECKANIQRENVAILINNQGRELCDVTEQEEIWKSFVFFYDMESDISSLFDDVTTSKLRCWIRDCYQRHDNRAICQAPAQSRGMISKLTTTVSTKYKDIKGKMFSS